MELVFKPVRVQHGSIGAAVALPSAELPVPQTPRTSRQRPDPLRRPVAAARTSRRRGEDDQAPGRQPSATAGEAQQSHDPPEHRPLEADTLGRTNPRHALCHLTSLPARCAGRGEATSTRPTRGARPRAAGAASSSRALTGAAPTCGRSADRRQCVTTSFKATRTRPRATFRATTASVGEPAEALDAGEDEPREHEHAQAEAVGDPRPGGGRDHAEGRQQHRRERRKRGLQDRALVPADAAELGEREMPVLGHHVRQAVGVHVREPEDRRRDREQEDDLPGVVRIGLHPADEHRQREDRAVDEAAEPLAERPAAGRRDPARLLEDGAQGAPGCLIGIRRVKNSERIAITPRIASAERSPVIRAS